MIEQKPYEMGYRSIELMLDVIKGQSVQDVYNTDVSVVRKEDLQHITRQDGDTP